MMMVLVSKQYKVTT